MGPPWRVFLLVLVYFIYLFFGATIFSAIEHPIEGRMVEELRGQKESFLKDHKCVEGEAEDQGRIPSTDSTDSTSIDH